MCGRRYVFRLDPPHRERALTLPTASQFRAARALLDWSLVDAAKKARVSVATVVTVEGRKLGRQADDHGLCIRAAFEAAGVMFTEDHDGLGVKLRRR